ncbi:substrate-binding domain-containing protein, partial [Rhodoplanes sp. SY1]|uniref:substrate-binding domain-containing protein n=1 Tax=Rhodoplanes sp. SY1 TaxID=3166646 RepID=UPI0038B45C01
QWNNAILTADNGGTALGTGTITVVHRSDGSGTNFLFTNALYEQCKGVYGVGDGSPNNASFEFVFTDRSTGSATGSPPVYSGACPALFYRSANATNWPDLATTQCLSSNPAYPGVGAPNNFANGNGNPGVIAKITTTSGSIGYSTTDYTAPVVVGGLKNANLQNQDSITSGSTYYVAPTVTAAKLAMSAANPRWDIYDLFKATDWSLQGIVPNPRTANAYPIAGFTWFGFYQCYATGYQSPIVNYLQFHYTDPVAIGIINSQGFGEVPSDWLNYIVSRVTDGTKGMGTAGAGTCAGQSLRRRVRPCRPPS